MYAQSYQDENSRTIPDTYSGVALRDSQNATNDNEEIMANSSPIKNPWENPCQSKDDKKQSGGFLNDAFTSIVNAFGFGKGERSFKLGTEEILIIGVAAFLLFSKERDIECIIMLVALLLIS